MQGINKGKVIKAQKARIIHHYKKKQREVNKKKRSDMVQ